MYRFCSFAMLLLALAAPAAAQSKSESFTTRYSSQYDAYTYETGYEFELPDIGSNSYQVKSSRDLIVDIYYNTRRVLLIDAAIQCEEAPDGDWITWARLSSHTHMATLRSTVFAPTDQCRVTMLFLNSDPDARGQRAAVRVNVASTTGGFMRLTKVPSWRLLTGGEGTSALPSSTDTIEKLRAAANR